MSWSDGRGSGTTRTASFATRVVEEIRDVAECRYEFDRIEPVDPRRGLDFAVESMVFGSVMIADVRHGEAVRITSRYPGHYGFVVPLTGGARGRVGASWVTLDRSHGAAFNPADTADLLWSARTELVVLYVPEATVTAFAAAAEALTGPVVFERSLDLDAPAVRTWRRMTALLREELRSGSPLLASPLAQGQIEQTLVAGLLAGLPNSTGLSLGPGAATGASRTVARTLQLIEDRPAHPWRVPDLAAAVGVSARTLQETFRRELGSTPLRELRRVRLERAHAELLRGDATTTSVTEVALRWGFPHLGRFSQAYREAHGRLPSASLAARPGRD
ncbi:AraC family transcriptional regulator [Nocardioides lentus]|uniref:AraC family transcriptional regulator n=1 Tax=Nocardioides lentus TaxID=338077 RepID=A0ABP5ATB1_9ACTN